MATTTNPTFSDIVALLNTLYNNDPNISNAPHGVFWQNTNRDDFVAIKTDNWIVSGPLITLRSPDRVKSLSSSVWHHAI